MPLACHHACRQDTCSVLCEHAYLHWDIKYAAFCSSILCNKSPCFYIQYTSAQCTSNCASFTNAGLCAKYILRTGNAFCKR